LQYFVDFRSTWGKSVMDHVLDVERNGSHLLEFAKACADSVAPVGEDDPAQQAPTLEAARRDLQERGGRHGERNVETQLAGMLLSYVCDHYDDNKTAFADMDRRLQGFLRSKFDAAKDLAAWQVVNDQDSGHDDPVHRYDRPLIVFQSKLHDVTVKVLAPRTYCACRDFVATKLLYTSSGKRVKSFAHKVGIASKVEWVDVADVVRYMQTIDVLGPCEDPVVEAPPCLAQPSVAADDVEDPVMRELVQRLCPHVLPPYAPSTVAAFEHANSMEFPADLKWFLTHVSRSLRPSSVTHDVISLCETEEDLHEDSPEVFAEMVRLRPGNPRVAAEVALEVVSLRRHGDTDSGRRLRRLHPLAVWDTRTTTIVPFLTTLRRMGKLPRHAADRTPFLQFLHERCKYIRHRVAERNIPVDMGPLWESRKEAPVLGYTETVDDTDPYCPGRMVLANFGCQCDAHLVVRGPFRGCITYMYQVDVAERVTVFPSFTSFAAIVCNADSFLDTADASDSESSEGVDILVNDAR
jgi:hypothetical protein